MESAILIFRIHTPMPTDSSPHSLSFPAQAHALVKKSRGVVAGGRGRSATTSTASAAATGSARNRSRSTATAPPTPASTATATCPNTKFTKYSVAALEAALGNDIERLHSFAANTELSGENILFLKSVEMWKTRWRACTVSSEEKVRRWEEAHKIWVRLVDRDTAEFPLNIEDAVYRNLERVFGTPHKAPTPEYEEKSCIVPFADDVTSRHSRRRTTGNSDFSAATTELMLLKETLGITMVAPKSRSNSNPTEASRSPPPHEEVTLEVFDKAEASVRQMVLENTWIRYVDSIVEPCSEALMSSSPTAGCHSWRWKSVFRKKSYQKFLGAGERD